MLQKCQGCGNDFECTTRKFNQNKKRSYGLFCSFVCHTQYKKQKHTVKVKCANCKKEIDKKLSDLKRSKTGNLYCSRSCSAAKNNMIFKRWENHPNFKNGKSSYRLLKLNSVTNPVCEKCGFSDINALDIHHIDKNRENNDLNNLQILCCNCHAIAHRISSG